MSDKTFIRLAGFLAVSAGLLAFVYPMFGLFAAGWGFFAGVLYGIEATA